MNKKSQSWIRFFCLLLLPFLTSTGRGEIVEGKGQGEVYYRGIMGTGTQDEQTALRLAQLDALKSYMAGLSTAKRKEYEKVREAVETNIGRFVKVGRVLDETKDTTQKRYTVTIRAEIDTSAIDDAVAKSSTVSKASAENKATLTFIFMSRKAATVRQFDDKRTQRVEKTNVQDETATQISTDSKEIARSESTTGETITTGGSTETKADLVQFEVRSSEDINSTVTRVFSDAGFEVTEAEMVQDETKGKMNLDAFRSDYSTHQEASAATRKNAAMGCKEIPIRYMVLGALDIGLNLRDPASGLIKVFVSVNAKVYDIPELPPKKEGESQVDWEKKANRGPKTVATVGPVQYSGLGPTQTVAERNALIIAGESAAAELVSQMRAKNLF